MARMNWTKVRGEAQIRRYGSKPLEVWLMKPDKKKPKNKKKKKTKLRKQKGRAAPKIPVARVTLVSIESQESVPTNAEEAVRQAMAEMERHIGGSHYIGNDGGKSLAKSSNDLPKKPKSSTSERNVGQSG